MKEENEDDVDLLMSGLEGLIKKIASQVMAERDLTPEMKEAILVEVRKALEATCFTDLVNAYYAKSGNLAHLASMLRGDIEFMETTARIAYEAYRMERQHRPEANIVRRFFQWLLLGEVYPW